MSSGLSRDEGRSPFTVEQRAVLDVLVRFTEMVLRSAHESRVRVDALEGLLTEHMRVSRDDIAAAIAEAHERWRDRHESSPCPIPT
jgi:hypothetical protein